jgi:hypothetical protein
MRIATVALLMAFACGIAGAEDSLKVATQRLSETAMFAFGGVGFIGRITQGERDFRVIQSQPPAVALESFEEIYAHGSAAGKIYALAGIRQLDPDRETELLKSLQGSDEKVMTMAGCVIESRRMIDLAKAIDSGSYDSYIKVRR